jgi:hypothetical protein
MAATPGPWQTTLPIPNGRPEGNPLDAVEAVCAGCRSRTDVVLCAINITRHAVLPPLENRARMGLASVAGHSRALCAWHLGIYYSITVEQVTSENEA